MSKTSGGLWPTCCLALLVWLCMPPLVSAQTVVVTGSLLREVDGTNENTQTDYSDAVVWLTPVRTSASVAPTPDHFEIMQKDKRFLPRILPIPVGSTVDFPNGDPFFHNVFSLFEGKRFDLGLYEAGTSQSTRFDRPGVSYIFCNIHPEMVAVVVSVATDLFGLTDTTGQFRIEDVPAGDYHLHVWHERMKTLDGESQAVSVGADDLEVLPIPMADSSRALESHTNKFGQEYESPSTGTQYLLPR